MDRRGIVLLCALTSCGAPAPTPRAEVEPAPIAEGGESVTPDEAPAPTPVEAVATAPRFEVPPPADLAAAIAARRPLIEIVPQACAESPGPVGASADVICLRDPRSGLVRATRRVNLSGSGVVAAARHGDDVVFTALDPAYAHTRYAGHLWRWTLADDRYAGLAEIPSHDDDGIDYGLRIVATDFGIVVRSWPGDDGEVDWLFAEGSLRRLRSVEGLNEIAVADGRTYDRVRRRQREVLSLVRLDGPRVVLDELCDYPRAYHLPLAAAFPEGRSLVVSAFPREDHTDVYVVEPPADEVRTVSAAIVHALELRVHDGRAYLRDEAGWHAVDLASGAVSEGAPPPEPEPAPDARSARSVHEIRFADGGLWLAGYGGQFFLDATGAHDPEWQELPAERATGCACDGAALVCGDTTLAGGCAEVAELERIDATGSDGEGTRSTLYSTGGAFRVDRLEPDLTRITRTSDGARIWVRMFEDGIFAQADDGAFEAPPSFLAARHALRWGRSLLDASVSSLAPVVAQFLRPSGVADFFAGRPLPAADTTLPP